MDKLKALGSKMSFTSTPGGKLSKAFRFDKEHNVLKRDPFVDGPTLEDVSVSTLIHGNHEVSLIQ